MESQKNSALRSACKTKCRSQWVFEIKEAIIFYEIFHSIRPTEEYYFDYGEQKNSSLGSICETKCRSQWVFAIQNF